ncbi:chromate resistance protein ChrB domain-containing protein [Pseudoxanthomonas sacheonensis]|uniref:Rhodanese-related sulfurtransferase n=1 Tax=Pseudoxanthomonas sacheonensis TaxID=443615 RepID=A0ABU1RSX9_9GAMM|nr:chromate resistance protein ChrB domain-containing protein [Pseudoxanthomonas sacheonensis]MDR6841219.1 rhodanese-related sulfurtransferase [Pseudoxanthomonas sacheonensis]
MSVTLLTGCGAEPVVYVTEHGLGPDKWATAWLLTKRISPGAQLNVVDIGKELPQGIAFDVPGSAMQRQGKLSAFEIVSANHQLDDPDTRRFGRIVHDIEIGAWGAAADADSPVVERAFRSLQERYGRDTTLPACYLKFFDAVHSAIRDARESSKAISSDALAVDCDQIATQPAPGQIVAQVPIEHLLAEMKRGKSVVFVDVREEDEFLEGHIPGALNLPIRDLDESVVQRVQSADYVVSYCIKDFRGFEMAKALKDAGVQNSVILNPFGIRGWVEEGLPTIGSAAMTEVDGQRRFTECIDSPNTCKAKATAKH